MVLRETRLEAVSLGGDGSRQVTLEPVYCLGQCACGPALMVDDERLEVRVTAASFDNLVEDLREVAP